MNFENVKFLFFEIFGFFKNTIGPIPFFFFLSTFVNKYFLNREAIFFSRIDQKQNDCLFNVFKNMKKKMHMFENIK